MGASNLVRSRRENPLRNRQAQDSRGTLATFVGVAWTQVEPHDLVGDPIGLRDALRENVNSWSPNSTRVPVPCLRGPVGR
jgi:hypothetical protein